MDINAFSTARRMIQALRNREVSAAELLELHLGRIERYDGVLNSIVIKRFDEARRDAADADVRLARGDHAPLLGLPITVKESIDLTGFPSTAGVVSRAGHRATTDATTVQRLKAAGAVIIGKTNVCVYLADYIGDNPLYGRTSNPWDLTRTPGGSTAGSAALAAGLVPLELGSDLGGSIRIPAAFCGLWGHKPSEGIVPYTGHFPGSNLPNPGAVLAAQGPHARSPGDLELCLNVIAGADNGMEVAWKLALPPSRHDRMRDFRVAVLKPVPWIPIDPEISQALEQWIQRSRSVGMRVDETTLPVLGDLKEYFALFRSMMHVMISLHWPADQRQQMISAKRMTQDVASIADIRGLSATATDYIHLLGQRAAYRAAWQEVFRDYDVVVTPLTLIPAFAHPIVPPSQRRLAIAGRECGFDDLSFYPSLPTLTGLPATAFPIGFNSVGLPVGLQAIGPLLEDRTPIHFCECLEAAFGGFIPPPGLWCQWCTRSMNCQMCLCNKLGANPL